MKELIINGDDFGYTKSCTYAIAESLSKGLISSTTAMANGEYLSEAVMLAKENNFLDKVGIHLNLTYGVPLTESIKNDPFFCDNGRFHNRINRASKLSKKQVYEVQEEINAQITALSQLGFMISHADSHHHIHNDIYILNAVRKVLIDNGITKMRIHRNMGSIPCYKKVFKSLYNMKLKRMGFKTTERMGGLKEALNNPGILNKHSCEIMIHPDYDESGELIDRKDKINDIAIGDRLDCIMQIISNNKAISYKEL